ncbi:copia proteinlike [Plasmopara halstedii]|uniref:Copia proteinlike n=1 Tax=Plasmopara halstedii TaxID=4781 RepID=A0A0P1AFC2_PLAHL|nr:copia proteinlike [Plasmopara halstedii]CEG39770.1 copia proteinlike [Plasmopara halstedii]|eukprot:XP_024576139.1 copia proteinlike [Plasmopara halstedii]
MRMVLEERDLWEVVNEKVKLEQLGSALDQSTFKHKARTALATICHAMEDWQSPLVRWAKDAYDVWSRLEAKMDEGDDVRQHIKKMKTLAEQLDAVDDFVTEDDLVITLLLSLSESFAFLITA